MVSGAEDNTFNLRGASKEHLRTVVEVILWPLDIVFIQCHYTQKKI